MFPILPRTTSAWTLDDLIARLQQHVAVNGILLMGSTATMLTRDSDYDLLLVMNDVPAPLHLIFTTVAGRLTEVYVQTTAQIDDLIKSDQPISTHSFDGALVRWLQTGRIVFDRDGRLRRAQARLQVNPRLVPPDESERYHTWFRINYNLLQTRRMLHAADPLYHQTVDFRLLYSLPEVLIGYLKLRELPWQGEKWALRYLQDHDPAFFDLWQRCIATLDRTEKVALYEQMAAHALEPVGGMWPVGATTVAFANDADAQPEHVHTALQWWQHVIA